MARTAMTLSQAQAKLDDVFPDSNLKLLEFTRAQNSCVICCPIHGEQRVSTYGNMLRSTLGCPECGRTHQQEAAAKRLVSSMSSYDNLSPQGKFDKVMQQLAELKYALVTANAGNGGEFEADLESITGKVVANKTRFIDCKV